VWLFVCRKEEQNGEESGTESILENEQKVYVVCAETD
jgi:hypothetical protein